MKGARNKKATRGLGKALARDWKNPHSRRRKGNKHKGRHITDLDADNGLTSILETTSLDDFLHSAVLAGRKFKAEKQNYQILDEDGLAEGEELEAAGTIQPLFKTSLKIPRRPKWDETTTKDELDEMERNSFLQWRRDRSDIVIQIVDCRNPMLYYCPDLVEYANDIDARKKSVLVLNKADYLPKDLRMRWARKLHSLGLVFMFFSAKNEQQTLDQEAEKKKHAANNKEKKENVAPEVPELNKKISKMCRILSRNELMTKIQLMSINHAIENLPELPVRYMNDGRVDKKHTVIGMVGFPNVGKSSLINVLMAVTAHSHGQRVAVGSQPGKTKHFQTLQLTTGVTLCDCPGLVFPSFVNSKAEMVINGILPIDKMRDYLPPTTLLTRRINRAYALARGYMTGHGAPDNARAARYILKDYVTGVLLYCFPPDDKIARDRVTQQIKERTRLESTLQTELKNERMARNGTSEVCFGWNGEGSLRQPEETNSLETETAEATAAALETLDDAEIFDPSMLMEGLALNGGGKGESAVPLDVTMNVAKRRGKGKNRMGHGRRKGRKARRFATENPYEVGSRMDDLLLEKEDLALNARELKYSGFPGSKSTKTQNKTTRKQQRRMKKANNRKSNAGIGVTTKNPFN
eukprot:GSMAST32.ASY1.ANO1.64.1 assembled CDS